MPCVFLSSSIETRDATGRDLLAMYDLLAPSCECSVYGGKVEAGARRVLTRADAGKLLSDPQTVAVYHHAAHWEEGEQLLETARARIVIKYHNVTPPDHLANDEAYWGACVLGRAQTYGFAYRYRDALWLSDSHFNLAEMGLSLLPTRAIVPPFTTGEAVPTQRPNSSLLNRLVDDPAIHLLTVGRIVPNKGHRLLVRVVEAYKRLYGGAIKAWIVGKLDPRWQRYYDSVVEGARRAGVEENFQYAGSVAEEDLLSYYLSSDVYLCCSSHEGFCVPLVESQRLRLPVAARECGAVRETLGENQILLADDPADYARAIRGLSTNETRRAEVVERGYINYLERFTYERTASAFLGALAGYLGGSFRT